MTASVARLKSEEALAVADAAFAAGQFDSAVDRAYFAMFHAARLALLVYGDVDVALLKSHPGVLVAFSEQIVRREFLPADLGRDINAIQRARHLADYGDRQATEDEAGEALAAAVRFCRAVFALTGEPGAES